ncbi:MAG: FaeA/PapI family transcriptional regulator [Myxococcota bacterium]|nr:FaeA/PapI family transcriptional regulator [Myxococcota bacterium]
MSGDSVWWSQRWMDCVLDVRELRAKVRKGRVLARRGRVESIEVRAGLVTAQVATDGGGSHSVRLRQRPLDQATWDGVVQRLAAQASHAAWLLAGKLTEPMVEAFEAEGAEVFPLDHHDLTYWCACGDDAAMCVHAVALHFALAEAIGHDPFVLMEFRGQARDAMMSGLSEHRPSVLEEVSDEIEPDEEREASASLAKKYWKAGLLPHLAFVMRMDEVRDDDTLPVVRALGAGPSETSADIIADTLTPVIRIACERLLKIVDRVVDEQPPPTRAGRNAESMDDVLVAAAHQHGALTTSLVAGALGISNTEARRYLQWLVQEGRLEVVGRARGTKYIPSDEAGDEI